MMDTKFNTGVYFYQTNNHSQVDYDNLYEFVKNISGVSSVWKSDQFPLPKINQIINEIKNNQIGRIVIFGESPGFIKQAFSKLLNVNDLSSVEIKLADFKSSYINGASTLDSMKMVVACAIFDIPFESDILAEKNKVIADTLVIGAGIAGIQASLEIANSNHKVYLVEKSGTIGGHMAMFDKTFPTLDCAACILTPKMVEVGQNPLIELITYSEVIGVEGSPGNYKVKILKKARRVNLKTCIGCGTCAEKCPGTAPSEFDAGTTLRKAIYIPFPQAVPNKYLIDPESCHYVLKGKCGVCVKNCPVEGCINLDEKDETVEINVGNIIVTTGFKTFDAKRIEQFGYGKYPNVVTSLEFERLINAAGPTEGNIRFRSQDKRKNWIFQKESDEPKSIAIVHCVGSRDENYNKYCSRVCCMYSLKLAHLVKEKIPKADVYEYYIDMRAFGKGYEEFYNRIKDEGIHIIRGRTAKIEEKNNQLILRSEDIIQQKIIEQQIDMVILAVGLEPREETNEVASILGLAQTKDGWLAEANSLYNSSGTMKGGIVIAGACQGPKDIPDTVAQASAAASNVIQSIIQNKVNQNIDNLSLDIIKQKVEDYSSKLQD